MGGLGSPDLLPFPSTILNDIYRILCGSQKALVAFEYRCYPSLPHRGSQVVEDVEAEAPRAEGQLKVRIIQVSNTVYLSRPHFLFKMSLFYD